MAQPWQIIDTVDTPEGPLELRQRGERDFLITINGRVLMNSSASRSEIALGELACLLVAGRDRPRVLIGGMGLGFTLRAALDSLPEAAQVIVAEVNPAVVRWCRGPAAGLTRHAVEEPRVVVVIDDVAAVIARAAQPGGERFDAIIIDLFEGPHATMDAQHDPVYGRRALNRTAAALAHGGAFAVWGENADRAFQKRLAAAGFSVTVQRPGRGGLRHVVYVARKGCL